VPDGKCATVVVFRQTCKDERGADITYDLMDSLYFFEYANQYYRKHEKIAPVADFKVSDADYADFMAFVKSKGFTYISPSKKMLEKLKEAMKKDNFTTTSKLEVSALEEKLDRSLDDNFATFREEIELMLSTEIVSRYYFQKGELQQSLKFDPCLKRSLEVLKDMDLYRKTLRPTPSTN
jgi:carboxyl-terminal processing protease